jgi:hypothetical protein
MSIIELFSVIIKKKVEKMFLSPKKYTTLPDISKSKHALPAFNYFLFAPTCPSWMGFGCGLDLPG